MHVVQCNPLAALPGRVRAVMPPLTAPNTHAHMPAGPSPAPVQQGDVRVEGVNLTGARQRAPTTGAVRAAPVAPNTAVRRAVDAHVERPSAPRGREQRG